MKRPLKTYRNSVTTSLCLPWTCALNMSSRKSFATKFQTNVHLVEDEPAAAAATASAAVEVEIKTAAADGEDLLVRHSCLLVTCAFVRFAGTTLKHVCL